VRVGGPRLGEGQRLIMTAVQIGWHSIIQQVLLSDVHIIQGDNFY
jgi:hypothetical protein